MRTQLFATLGRTVPGGLASAFLLFGLIGQAWGQSLTCDAGNTNAGGRYGYRK